MPFEQVEFFFQFSGLLGDDLHLDFPTLKGSVQFCGQGADAIVSRVRDGEVWIDGGQCLP